jgi:hypothetical protein
MLRQQFCVQLEIEQCPDSDRTYVVPLGLRRESWLLWILRRLHIEQAKALAYPACFHKELVSALVPTMFSEEEI